MAYRFFKDRTTDTILNEDDTRFRLCELIDDEYVENYITSYEGTVKVLGQTYDAGYAAHMLMSECDWRMTCNEFIDQVYAELTQGYASPEGWITPYGGDSFLEDHEDELRFEWNDEEEDEVLVESFSFFDGEFRLDAGKTYSECVELLEEILGE